MRAPVAIAPGLAVLARLHSLGPRYRAVQSGGAADGTMPKFVVVAAVGATFGPLRGLLRPLATLTRLGARADPSRSQAHGRLRPMARRAAGGDREAARRDTRRGGQGGCACFGAVSRICQSVLPASILARSRMPLMRRVSRSLSCTMMLRNSLRCSTPRSGLSWTISLKERIEVSGVRNSWLMVETKSSFILSRSFSRSLAAVSSAVAAPARGEVETT